MVAMLCGIEAMGHQELVQGLPRALHGPKAVQCSISCRGSALPVPGFQSCHCMVEVHHAESAVWTCPSQVFRVSALAR